MPNAEAPKLAQLVSSPVVSEEGADCQGLKSPKSAGGVATVGVLGERGGRAVGEEIMSASGAVIPPPLLRRSNSDSHSVGKANSCQ